MLIVGCDFHSRFQQIAMVDTETGELVKHRLEHSNVTTVTRLQRGMPARLSAIFFPMLTLQGCQVAR